jgi:ADP-ribose pyrophosphatase
MRDMKWKTLKSEYLYKDTWFTIRKDTCERPDGKIISPYYVYEFPTWVTAVALTTEKKVVMVRQYRHALGETIMEIPGGCVDDTDKSLKDAVARELLEETGYVFDEYLELGKISANPSTNNNWMHMFLAKAGKLTEYSNPDHNEDLEVHLVSLDELKQMLRENKIVQSMHAATIFYALKKLGEIDF